MKQRKFNVYVFAEGNVMTEILRTNITKPVNSNTPQIFIIYYKLYLA